MRGVGQQGRALEHLIVGEREIGGDLIQPVNVLLKQREAFRPAAVKGEDTGFREERPAAVVQRTSVWIVAMMADLNFRMILGSNKLLKCAELIPYLAA